MSERPPKTFAEETADDFPGRVFTAEECTPEVVAKLLQMAAARYETEREGFIVSQSAVDGLAESMEDDSVFTLYSSLYTMLFTDSYDSESVLKGRNKALVTRLATMQALRRKLE